MALVLEVKRRGQPAPRFVRVSDRELADGVWLGRGYNCDVLLDDPHVHARHARLVAMDGRLMLTLPTGSDLSVDRRPVTQAIEVRSGATLALGHTQVRVYDAEHPVAPTQATDALVDGMAWLTRPALLVPLLIVVVLAHALDHSLRQMQELDLLTAVLSGVAPLLLCIAWAGLWALVTRVLRHEARFSSHLAVALIATIASLALGFLGELLEYNTQSRSVREWTDNLALTSLLAVVLMMHLRITMGPLRWFWQTPAAAVAVAFVGYSVLMDIANERDWRGSPEYTPLVLPDGLRWRSDTDIDAFNQRSTELFDAVDAERAELDKQDLEDDGQDSDELSLGDTEATLELTNETTPDDTHFVLRERR